MYVGIGKASVRGFILSRTAEWIGCVETERKIISNDTMGAELLLLIIQGERG
jgi:hypothetical protein